MAWWALVAFWLVLAAVAFGCPAALTLSALIVCSVFGCGVFTLFARSVLAVCLLSSLRCLCVVCSVWLCVCSLCVVCVVCSV